MERDGQELIINEYAAIIKAEEKSYHPRIERTRRADWMHVSALNFQTFRIVGALSGVIFVAPCSELNDDFEYAKSLW